MKAQGEVMRLNALVSQLKHGIVFLLALFAISVNNLSYGQCTVNGVTIEVVPTAPIQFQFFPLALLGVGDKTVPVSGFERFGIRFINTNPTASDIFIDINARLGNDYILRESLFAGLTIPSGSFFVSVNDFLGNNIPSNLKNTSVQVDQARINKDFLKRLSGGLPSGTFVFEIRISDEASTVRTAPICGTITAEILSGATVDLIIPANGSESSSLPLFQWAAVGGNEFILTVAKLKPNQSHEDALRTSSQRMVINFNNTTSYQTTAGGPVVPGVQENNLTWNPGLALGEYVYRVSMLQRDPITNTQNTVNSNTAVFSVKEGGINTGLNTQEIIAILSTIPGLSNLQDLMKGYSATGIEIDGKTGNVEELRGKVKSLEGKTYKVSIKP